MKDQVSASVLSADLLHLGAEIDRLEKSGADMLHFDVMDGIFVNNISYGLPLLEQVRSCTDMILDVHLMITRPERYVERFAKTGADIISFHLEATDDVRGTISAIRAAGAKVSLAIKPATPAQSVFEYLPLVDMVLVMTVEPGFGGQSLIPETLEKVEIIRRRAQETGLDLDIEVDGGINAQTAPEAKKAGANVIVSGSFLFRADDMKKTVELIKEGNKC
ncbi:MAG: ribulose-phosphate 3-epimerase [Ruminococcus sp.]|nr:ribulose-phosphate 3-epimerase [Ruminococcus sp.]